MNIQFKTTTNNHAIVMNVSGEKPVTQYTEDIGGEFATTFSSVPVNASFDTGGGGVTDKVIVVTVIEN